MEFIQNYNFNSVYICLLFIIFKICNTQNIIEYILSILSKLNYIYISFLIINLIGIYLFLKNLSIEINIKWSIKYK